MLTDIKKNALILSAQEELITFGLNPSVLPSVLNLVHDVIDREWKGERYLAFTTKSHVFTSSVEQVVSWLHGQNQSTWLIDLDKHGV